jgi:hypothetical protein
MLCISSVEKPYKVHGIITIFQMRKLRMQGIMYLSKLSHLERSPDMFYCCILYH